MAMCIWTHYQNTIPWEASMGYWATMAGPAQLQNVKFSFNSLTPFMYIIWGSRYESIRPLLDYFLDGFILFTPSIHPPLLREWTEYHNKYEVQHNSFTEHLPEHREKAVMQKSSHKYMPNLNHKEHISEIIHKPYLLWWKIKCSTGGKKMHIRMFTVMYERICASISSIILNQNVAEALVILDIFITDGDGPSTEMICVDLTLVAGWVMLLIKLKATTTTTTLKKTYYLRPNTDPIFRILHLQHWVASLMRNHTNRFIRHLDKHKTSLEFYSWYMNYFTGNIVLMRIARISNCFTNYPIIIINIMSLDHFIIVIHLNASEMQPCIWSGRD